MPSKRLRPEDLLVEFRDVNLVRQGAIPVDDLRLQFQPVFNGVGSWVIQLPAEHRAVPYLRTPGSGILITNLQTGKTLLSGSTSKPSKKSTAEDVKGMVTIGGLDDNRLAFDARAFPEPGIADPFAQTKAYDIRTGSGETIMRQYAAFNICNGAIAIGGATSWAPAGRRAGLRNKLRLGLANSPMIGGTTTQRARFDNLGELLNKIALESGGLGWRIVQNGSYLEFEIYQPTDRSAFIRLDVINGTLTEQNVEFAPPEVTREIVAGQGDLEKRQFLQVTTSDSLAAETDWGLVIEEFMDQRQTNSITELNDAGRGELLARGFTKVAIKATPANDQTMIFMTDFFMGDKVSVVIDGQEQPNSHVTEAAIVVDDTGLHTAVAIGDIKDFDSDSALRGTVADTVRRVEKLETSNALVADRIGQIGELIATDANTAVNYGHYRISSSSVANIPTATGLGSLDVLPGGNGSTIRQVFRRLYWDGTTSTYGSGHDMRIWERSSNDGGLTWSVWLLVRDNDTGWVSLTPYLTGGFTATAGNIEARISDDGFDVEIRGSMSAPALAASATGVDFLTGIPSVYLPTKRIGFGVALNDGWVCTTYIRTDGTGAISRRNGLSGSTQFTIRYMKG